MCPWLSLLDIGKDTANINPDFIWGLNFSIRRQVVVDCNGFHPDLVPTELQRWQGDGETGLTKKVRSLGYRADYLQDAGLYHLCGNDRLNIDYFCKRAYYQGVCDSFTSIRSGSPPESHSLPSSSLSFFQKARNLLRKARLVLVRTLATSSAGTAKVYPDFIWGLNFSIRKQVVVDCNGFHPDLVPENTVNP